MKKLLFVITNLGGGGAEKVLVNILNHLDYSLYQVDLLLIYKEGVYINAINPNVNLKYVFLTKNSIELQAKNKFQQIAYKIYKNIADEVCKKFPQLIYRFVLRDNYDVEIGFLEGRPSHIISRSSNKKSQKISWIHIDLKKHRMISYKKERKILGKMDKIICVSKEAQSSLIDLYPQDRNKVQVVYNAIDSQNIIKLSKEPQEYIPKKPYIVSVGRLNNQKGFDILIDAHKKLLNDGVDHELLILGEGEDRDYLKQTIRDLNVENSVVLLGFKRNPYQYISNCDVFVVASRYEGFSLVLAEAIILEKPIVSTKCAGPTELLDNGEFGLMVDIEDSELLKDALKNMLLNTELKNKYVEKVKIRKSIFNIQEVMKNVVNAIEN